MGSPPIRNVPVELNRRLDSLEQRASGEVMIEIIKKIVPGGDRSSPGAGVPPPTISLKSVTSESITVLAFPTGEDLYEFALRMLGTEGWNTLVTSENTATFISLKSNTQYEARVRILNPAGESGNWSGAIVVITDEDRIPPPVPENLDLTAESYYLRAKVDEIPISEYPDLGGYEFHASLETGFTPDDDTLKQVGISNRCILHVSEAGQTWYMVVRSYDYNRNYSDYCDEESILIPVPHLPPQPGEPTDPGDIVIVEGTEEIDDCDDYTTWEGEVGGIQVAADTETVKEGSGSLKISVDKYAPVAENLWYTIPNPPGPPQIPGTYTIGSLFTTYVVQGFQVGDNLNLQRVGIIAWEGNGSPPGLRVMLYSDDGSGNPNAKLGEADFASVDGNEYWRFADFSPVEALTSNTQYHLVFCRTDEGYGDYYEARIGINNYSDGIFQYGDALNNLTKDESRDVIFRCFDDTASLNQHFKISSLGAKDISTHEAVECWIKSGKTVASWLQASMGESALGEQTDNITPGTAWGAEDWNISGIAAASRNAIAHFGFKVLDSDPLANPPSADDGKVWTWLDYVRATKEKAVKIKFSDNVINLWPQFARFNVKDYGAKGDGVTDDTAAIQATITRCAAAGGGIVFFPRGIYLISSTLSLPSYVMLLGEASMYNSYTMGSMLWLADNSDCDMIANSDSSNGNYNIRIRDLQLNGNRTNQASGSGIVFTKTYKCYLEDVYLNQIKDYGIYVNNTGGLIGNIFLTRVFTMNIFDHAVYLHDTSDAVIEGCELIASPTKYCLYIADGGSHYISNTDMESSYIGCYINGGVNNRFSNSVFYNNEKQGLFIYDSRSNKVVGCDVIQNGQADADGNEEGILITDSDYNTITANICEDNQGSPTQKYGIREYGTSDYNTIQGNICRLNVTAQISVLGSNTVFKGNIPEGETLTAASPTLMTWGFTKIDSTSNAVDGTLGSGQYAGQIKTIVMIEASNSSTISITNHETSDPEVATFDAVDETGVFMWTGTEWVTLKATCTFV